MYLRGVIGFHPEPRIMEMASSGSVTTIRWAAPLTKIVAASSGAITTQQHYRVEVCTSLAAQVFSPVYTNLFANSVIVTNEGEGVRVYRVVRTP